ncbi:MAG TPA: HD domain-containing protein [Planctomycetaceae bacterium]|nr:HD domain-containing protein [Planctomycetaceae bacterium]
MSGDKLRQQILFEAARLMFQRQEQEYARAKQRAARTLCRQRLRPSQLPTNREIREELERLSNGYAGASLLSNANDDLERLPSEGADRFRVYRHLLAPLAKIEQDHKRHPEGDVLYHSLQVFSLASDELAYDEEFRLAALLHDVGKGIDPYDSIAAGLRALGDSISVRTAWLIENHALARGFLDGRIGVRARRRLQQSEDYEELILLAKCDLAGRVPGANVPELDEALAQLRELAADND